MNQILLLLWIFCISNILSQTCIDDCLDEFGKERPSAVVNCIKNCYGDCKDGLVHIHGPDMIKEPTCCD